MTLGTLLCLATLLAPAGSTEVAVRLTDGSRVSGTIAMDKLKFATAQGPQAVPLDRVRRLSFGETTTLVTVDGKTVEGRVGFTRLTVKTRRGGRAIPRSELRWLDVVRAAPLTPGKMTEGCTRNGMAYFVRVPRGYKSGTPHRAILVFHGSNMSANAYVNTIAQAWPAIGKDFVLVGISGEHRHPNSKPESPFYNYSYVGWRGAAHKDGANGVDESPPLVMAALDEIQESIPMSSVLVGGHSQGGYLTYTLFMHYPDRFAGAFPVSGGCIVQAEPTEFTAKKVRAAQRSAPIAIVHGENDGAVDYSLATSALESFIDDGHPRVRLFSHPRAAHMFAVLPVDRAIRWLEVMAGDDLEALAKLAEERQKAKDDRSALAAARRAAEVADGSPPARVQRVLDGCEARAAAPAKALKAAMGKKGNAWVDAFYEFRDQYAFTDAATPVLAAFARLRKAHQKPGAALFWKARADFQRQDEASGYAKCEQIVQQYYACSFYKIAKRWLANRGK